jgi:hypothetical protein
VFEGVAAAARYPEDGANEEQHYASDCGSSSRAAAAAGNGAACSATNPAASSGLSNNRTVRISGDAAYQAAREEQWEVEERRKELLVLFRNTAKLAFPEALAFVGGRVQAVLARAAAEAAAAAGGGGGGGGAAAANGVAGGQGGGSAGGLKFQDSELAVTLVYELGEGAPEEAMRPGSGGLSQLVLLLLEHAGSLPAGQHRLVALALLETCVRYCKLLQQAASAAAQQQQQGGGGGGGGGGGAVASVLPGVLGLFLGPRGLGHPSAAVATRGAYLLSRLVKMLRNSLRPYLGELLRQLQPYLEVVATQPPPSSSAAVGTSRDAAAGRAPVTAALVDDRLYVFESVGLLLGQEELQPDEQLAALQQLLQPLLRQVEANLGPAAAEPAGGGGAGSASWAILQSLEAIARLNKGFKAELCSRRPQLGESPELDLSRGAEGRPASVCCLYPPLTPAILLAPLPCPNHRCCVPVVPGGRAGGAAAAARQPRPARALHRPPAPPSGVPHVCCAALPAASTRGAARCWQWWRQRRRQQPRQPWQQRQRRRRQQRQRGRLD